MAEDNSFNFKLENVSYVSGGNPVLEDINLAFERNRVTLVTGPSGSGKSTLLRLMGMLISPTSGEIFYKGKSLDEFDPSEYRSKAVMVGQKPYLVDGSVMDNLMLPFKLKHNKDRNISEETFVEYLSRIGLDRDFLSKKSKKISGGEAQRMGLVRALALNPETLLLDEPTSALDMSSEEQVVNLLRESKKVRSIVVVAHSPAYLQLADRAVVLKNGRVANCKESMSPKELKDCLEGRI
jgi:putative ABC transport system ATP-binding protein